MINYSFLIDNNQLLIVLKSWNLTIYYIVKFSWHQSNKRDIILYKLFRTN